jgi:Restriction endonuclease BglII
VKVAALHSHLNGHEWMVVHRPGTWEEIEAILAAVDAEQCRTKQSKEKTKLGKMLYSPEEINKRLKEEFRQAGWDESRTSYWVTDDYELIRKTVVMAPAEQRAEIEAAGKRPILSYNQTDFVKDRVAVEVQLGKYSFIAYDLFVKHMAFYVGDKIDVGVEILPVKAMQEEMSSGPGYYEVTLFGIARQGRGVPAVPIVLIGLGP